MKWTLTFLLCGFLAGSLALAEEQAEPLPIAEKLATQNASSEQVALKETEIPLNIESPKKAANDSSGMFRFLFSISILGLLATGSFYFIRKYGKSKGILNQTKIKVLTQHHLGPKKSLVIVSVAGESILLGVTDHNISMIKSLSLIDDDVPEEVPAQFGLTFGKTVSREQSEFKPTPADLSFELSSAEQVADRTPAAKVSFANRSRSHSSNQDSVEEFSFGGIKDAVSKKLKGMRNLDV